jgi:hypothetical protein
MRKIFSLICFIGLTIWMTGCSKSKGSGSTTPPAETTRNNVNVIEATSAFNAYRTKGYESDPATTALVWNDTLSDAAFKFAQDIAAQGDGTGGSVYTTATGGFLLDYPKLLGYKTSANLGECFRYPSTTDVKTMIDATFASYSSFKDFVDGVMDPSIRKFGIGEFNNRWYFLATK